MTPEQTQALLAARLVRAVHDGQNALSVELHPAELGRIEVNLQFHADGVGVQMTVDRRETFDSFTRDRSGLEQQLSQAGINLGSGGLNLRFGSPSGRPMPGERTASVRSGYVAAAQPVSSSRPASPIRRDGRVDILA